MNQLSNHVKTNQTTLRYIIQYEALHKRPIMESYLHFCTIVGDDAMSYPDFEFWFMRFSNGDLDVNYERPTGPRNLTTFPVEIVGKIIEHLDPVSRIITRHVSKSLRFVTDHQKPNVKRIEYRIYPDIVYIHLDGNTIKYEKKKAGCLIAGNNMKTLVEGVGHEQLALTAIEGMLKHPKLKLRQFSIIDRSNVSVEVLKLMKVPETLLTVKYLQIETLNPDVRSHILGLMKPGALIEVGFLARRRLQNSEFSLGNITETEQWKRLKAIDLRIGGCLNDEDIQKLHSFPIFTYRTDSIHLDDLVALRNKLQNTPTFELCEIEVCKHYPVDFINQVADAIEIVADDDVRIRDPIPGSDHFLLFEFAYFEFIRISRKHV